MKRKNYANMNKDIRDRAARLYQPAFQAYIDKRGRARDIRNYWDIFNCTLTANQAYEGDSEVFVPIAHDAVEARVKRRLSMIWPNVGQKIGVTCEAGDPPPNETIGMLDHHCERINLKKIIASTLRRGDVEGQYNWLLDWERSKRTVTRLASRSDDDDPTREVSDIEKQTLVREGPVVKIIPDADLAVLPATVECIQDANMVILTERYSKEDWEDLCEDMGFRKADVKKMGTESAEDDPNARRAEAAGVKVNGDLYSVYRIWKNLDLGDGREPCEIYLGGPGIVLGVYKNPFWSGRVPILSESAEVNPGSFWGKSKLASVEQLQYQANDVINMGMDTARFSILPITMTDPVKNPNIGSMVLAVGAIWETNPNDTQFAQFPALWKDAFTQLGIIKAQMMESMDVNDVMMGNVPQGRKNAQAVAAQQQEALASITDSVRIFERFLSEALEWFYELDLQYREEDLLVEIYGEVGRQIELQRIPPSQISNRYVFKWTGSDQTFGMQRVQQMIGFMNVLRGVGPQALGGRRLDLGPSINYMTSFMFGPHLAPKTLVDERHMLTVDPEDENEMLHNNLPVEVHPTDDDAMHMRAHMAAAAQTGDPYGDFRLHIMHHAKQLQMKTMAANPQQPPQGLPGVPGGAGMPGVAGTPRPGAMPAPQRPVQNPPGAIHPDQMGDGMAQPRG